MTPTSRRIRKAREMAGLSLDELAHRIGMSKTGYWQIEQGCGEPQFSSVVKIAKALDVSLDWIASGGAHPDVAALRKTLLAVLEKAKGGAPCH